MLEPVLGSTNAERVLMFILARGEGYAREMALCFETDLSGLQKQLEKFEAGSVLTSRPVGRTRLYTFNPRYPFLAELKTLLEKALSFYPTTEREALRLNRRRPRQKGKPLEIYPPDDPQFPGITYRRGAAGRPTPVLRGSVLRVQTLVIDYKQGLAPEQIAAEYELETAQVKEALAFYEAHRLEIETNLLAEQALESGRS